MTLLKYSRRSQMYVSIENSSCDKMLWHWVSLTAVYTYIQLALRVHYTDWEMKEYTSFFFFFSSNEILNLRLNICLSYLFVVVKTIYEKCKTKLRCYPSNNLFKHFSYKQFYSINMLFASFTLERYLKSTHTYRIGYHD